ncbi:unnamed protein product, partial [Prorocentrum cordatum]
GPAAQAPAAAAGPRPRRLEPLGALCALPEPTDLQSEVELLYSTGRRLQHARVVRLLEARADINAELQHARARSTLLGHVARRTVLLGEEPDTSLVARLLRLRADPNRRVFEHEAGADPS